MLGNVEGVSCSKLKGSSSYEDRGSSKCQCLKMWNLDLEQELPQVGGG